ncbi:uncharacterized protein LOC113777203 isoform X1 [Coffea eugenioides]|uniref:uncharacterized protein LOC113777203 isoform X1 n=1 Tax=Coffea eugenioides TaxID=49369 RepID=UPI000F604A4E|nr:uncharacterized protein LOC113777203 isoform X1 [Coffea eugenioides]
METLYTKLYNKYIKLKKEKDTAMENLNRDQEKKFMNYVIASDEMIEFLRSENERLGNQVSELRSEMALLRSTKDEECIQYNKLLMEENLNNKKLQEEIERLRNLQREGRCCQARDDKVGDEPVDMPVSSQVESYSSDGMSVRKTRKRSRQSLHGRGDTITPSATKEHEHEQLNVLSNRSCKETEASDTPSDHYDVLQPAICKRKMNNPGSDVAASCMFQELVEWVVGLKLSIIPQSKDFCISALHPSSGYSFTLTWVNNSKGEPELLYHVLALGTFERVAPEWMRDVLMFSMSMCPTFFHRVSRVIQLNH